VEGIFPTVWSAASTQTIEINASPDMPTITQDGAALVSSVASGNQWFANGVAISGANGQRYTPTKAQIDANSFYTVVVTNSTGCTSVSSISQYNAPLITGIDNPSLSAKLSIYPNPTNDKVNIRVGLEKVGKVNLKLTDAAGRVVFAETVESNSTDFSHELNLSDYASGTYILLLNVDGKTAVKKVVKQ
jgi:hypothetical protein